MDELNQVLRREEQTMYRLRALYRSRGYLPYKMNKFEEYDLYARNKNFLKSEQVLTFTDTDGRLMALKPDVTLSIIKNVQDDAPGLQKLCYSENVYRPSGAAGGFREIVQAGLECIGALDLYAMGEVVLLALQSLACISENHILSVSHLGFLAAALDQMTPSVPAKQEILRCICEKNHHELAAVCKEARLDSEDAQRVLSLAKLRGPLPKMIPELVALCPDQDVELTELVGLHAMLQAAGAEDKIVVDLSTGGDMHYYNGLVFQGFVEGISAPILSGGRYDALVQRMGKIGGAIGFAVYLDLLEQFDAPSEYDVDALLTYGDTTDLLGLQRAADKLRGEVSSLRVEREAPEGLRSRQRYRYFDGKVEKTDA